MPLRPCLPLLAFQVAAAIAALPAGNELNGALQLVNQAQAAYAACMNAAIHNAGKVGDGALAGILCRPYILYI